MWVHLLGLNVGTFGVRSWVALGVLLGSLRLLLRRLGSHLGCSWGELGVPLGCSEGLLCVAWVLLGALGPPRGLAEEVLGVQGSFGETGGRGKVVAMSEKTETIKRKTRDFRGNNGNAKHHYQLSAKVAKGVAWGALGLPWDGLGRPLGPKSSPELTF